MTTTCPSCGAAAHPGISCFQAVDRPVLPDDFADVPQSIGELRVARERNAAAWSPRDVLVSLLREIDSGQVKPTAMVVTMSVEFDDGSIGHGFRNATPNNFVALGLLSRCAFRLQES